MNAMDYILRKVKFSDKPYGGILIISSGDHKQLKPVQGHKIWMSPDFIIQYSVLKLRHYVRCSGDHNLMAVLELFRKGKPSEEEIQRVLFILETNCSVNSVDKWSDVPRRYFCIVTTIKATLKIISEYLKYRILNDRHFIFVSKDEVQCDFSTWSESSDAKGAMMDKLFRKL